MSRKEVAFLEAILYCQKFELGWMPSDLRVLEAGGSHLNDAGLPFVVLLEQYEPQAVYGGVSHRVQGIALFIRLQMLELGEVLYHMVKLLLVKVRPMKLGAFVCQAPKFVCGHRIVGAKLPEVSNESKEGVDTFCGCRRLNL